MGLAGWNFVHVFWEGNLRAHSSLSSKTRPSNSALTHTRNKLVLQLNCFESHSKKKKEEKHASINFKYDCVFHSIDE